MADVFIAYEFLNKSLDLNLSKAEIEGREAIFKQQFMEKKGFTDFKVEDWEFFLHLEPVKRDKQ